jgi:hypothetical protein
VAAEARTWTGAAAARRKRELGRIAASIKREIARAEHGRLELGDLLSTAARDRIDTLRRGGVGTLVLDECHHLASLWGYVVRTAVEELGDVHVVGLTATPPDELTREEAALYEALLGPVDFTVPTPAVVRERFLAPYQELAWLTEPLESERRWLAEHDLRFRELVTALHDDEPGPLSFPVWVLTRLRERTREGEDARVSWASFQRGRPELARAGARFLASAGLARPEGAPHGEGYREQPNLEDWLVLLEDYALRCLSADPSPAAAGRLDAIGAALRDLGFSLTRQGIRRGRSDVDRLLTGSAAKLIALVQVLTCELDARRDRLRALVLVDAERAAAVPDAGLVGVLRPEAGTAPEAVRALAEDGLTAGLRPLLVSGRGLRCAAADAEPLLAALRRRAPASLEGWRAEPDGAGLVRLLADGPEWRPRLWVGLATAAFATGVTRVLVGTRALLGEGWDAPCVNCLVDLSAATTSVSVTQMRGRSLRLDPADPEKIASNWDVVCVAPGVVRGDADYDRFVRKHLRLFAPSEDGELEAGPSHVHPALGPFAPPPASEFDEIDGTMAHRAAEHEAARARWKIGESYVGEEHETLVVRPRRSLDRTHERPAEPPSYPIGQGRPLALASAAALAAPVGAGLAGEPAVLAGLALVPLAAGWALRRLLRVRRELHEPVPLDLTAYAVRDAYVDLGELERGSAASLAIEPRASAYLRVWLRRATTDETARFTAALNDIVDPAGFPRYLVSRLVPGRRSALALLWRAATRRPPFDRRWEAVPDDLGRRRDRAETFARAWERWLGPSELRFTQRSEEGRAALAAAGAEARDYDVRVRRIWL